MHKATGSVLVTAQGARGSHEGGADTDGLSGSMWVPGRRCQHRWLVREGAGPTKQALTWRAHLRPAPSSLSEQGVDHVLCASQSPCTVQAFGTGGATVKPASGKGGLGPYCDRGHVFASEEAGITCGVPAAGPYGGLVQCTGKWVQD